jgi:hypothetical protein
MNRSDGKSAIIVEKDRCIINMDKIDDNSMEKVDKDILKNIKIDNIHSIVHEISKNGIYQIAYWPKGGHLTENTDGTITVVFRDENGKILQHGKIKKVGPDLVNISKAIANQVMLVYIIAQLKDINIKLDNIIKGQHDDRISEIEGAIKTYNCFSNDDKSEANIVVPIILQIQTGIAKLERELKNEFNELEPNAKFSDNWVSDKNDEIKTKYYNIAESISWIIKGYEVLIDWDINHNIKNRYNNSVEEFIQFLDNGKWNKLVDFSRALPYKQNSNIGYPEEIWENINNRKPEMIEILKKQLKLENNDIKEYIFETNGSKLLEVLNEL